MAGTMKQIRPQLSRVLGVLCLALLFLFAGFGAAIFEVLLHIPGSSITCGPPPPYLKPVSSLQAVFTAHILYVGRFDPRYALRSGRRYGPWAIAYVEHQYWGLPWWSSQIVVLAPGWYQEGETYFVDGKSAGLPYSRFLPIVYTGPCNRTRPLSEAVVDTRILSQGPPRGVRIIGRTYRRKHGGVYEPSPGVRVEIKGPSGSTYLVSDTDAVYDFSSPTAGVYTVQLENPDRRDYPEGPHDRSLSTAEVWNRDVYSQ
jgi:hypothetical protein